MDLRFEVWNVRSLCTEGSLKTVASELAKCELDLVAVKELIVGGSQPADDCTFLWRWKC